MNTDDNHVLRGDETDYRALVQVARALIEVNGGECYSVAQLASLVTKASRFLFPPTAYYRGESESRRQTMDREARCFMELAHSYIRAK